MSPADARAWLWLALLVGATLLTLALAGCGAEPLDTTAPRTSTFGDAPAAPAAPAPAAQPTAVRVEQAQPAAPTAPGGVGDYPTAEPAAPPPASFDPIDAMRNTTPQTVPMSEVQP